MKFQKLLTEDCTECAVPVSSKKRILEKISLIAANKYPDLDAHCLLDALMEREKMSSTGIGNGIAIPHGRLKGVDHPLAVMITTDSPIEFDAIDNRPVDVFVALFVPEEQCKQHLSTLQSIAQLLSQQKVLKQIRHCNDAHQLYNLVHGES